MDRLRWDNIARAAAVLAVIVLVVAWPHLKRRDPAMPSAAATPVSVEGPAPETAPQAPPPARRPQLRRRRDGATVRRAKRPSPALKAPVRVKRPRRVAPRRAPPRRLTPPRRAPREHMAPRPRPAPSPQPIAPPAGEQAAREFAIP